MLATTLNYNFLLQIYRWKIFQPHDVLAECRRISLDPLDCIKEGTQLNIDDSFRQPNQNSVLENSISSLSRLNNLFPDPDRSHSHNFLKKSETGDKSQSKLMLNALENVCNPSDICHMTTPPTSRPISPSHSAHDLRSVRNPVSSDIETGSIQSLNESQNFGNKSPLLLHKTMSSENVSQRSAILKSFMSSQSTPLDKESISSSRKSTPISPKRSGSYKQPKVNRPTSSEFLKSLLGNSGNFDYHSAPTSPMIPPVNVTGASQFSFNMSDVADEPSKGESHNKSQVQRNRPESPFIQSENVIDINVSLKKLFEETNSGFHVNRGGDQLEFSNIDASYHQHQAMLNARSPVQILDDFIQFGTEINSLLINK